MIREPEDYVVASIIANEADWYTIDNRVKRIKKKHFPFVPEQQVELHAKDMENNTGIFNGIPHEKILEIFDDVFDLVSQPDFPITIVAALIQKNRLRKKTLDLEEWGHRLLLERLNKFVEKQNSISLENGNSAQFGIIIEDTEGEKKDEKLRNKMRTMLTRGTFYSNIEYLIEDPLFTNSKWRNLSQLTDCVAYCIRRNYKIPQNPKKAAVWQNYFNIMTPKLDDNEGTYLGYGLKIFPP